jgi:hypothetical protein
MGLCSFAVRREVWDLEFGRPPQMAVFETSVPRLRNLIGRTIILHRVRSLLGESLLHKIDRLEAASR